MPVSGDTLLRLIRSARCDVGKAPRIIGIDEWAWKRGQTYGTILCDLETNRVLDLLPDREADTVSAWLKRHPGVEVVARDRATVFAQAMRDGAPKARQVADRWHLLHNLGGALRTAVDRHRGAVSTAGGIERSSPDERGLHKAPVRSPGVDGLRSERRQARAERYAAISRLHADGLIPKQIGSSLGMSQRSVERWLAAGGEPEHRRPPVASLVDPFRPYLDKRWREGCQNTRQLWREIVADGFKGSFATLARWAAPLRSAGPTGSSVSPPTPSAAPRPSRRRCAWLLGRERDDLTAAEQSYIERVTAAAPALATASTLARSFAVLVRGGDASGLDAWIASALDSELSSLATGLGRDRDAVAAAIAEPWSTSPVEGAINRLKTLKRQMYGRAGYDLLRARVLAA
jgi:transposase